ncbi:DUF4153 domain-containing protein [Rhodococcoides yunnanense]|uniref:DUF4153 domain-containing protein n=1 Tax=Rhodococcoides yunnanense TaxID=278209 RepID=UPI000B0E6642|nr:DUF4173 domain-containing protein [Rhodococcus yunnanensis]
MIIIDPPKKPVDRTHRSLWFPRLWSPRVWPARRSAAAGPATSIGAVVVGCVGAFVLGAPGIGYSITAAAVVAVAAISMSTRPSIWQITGATAVLALSSVAAIRAAEWLVTLAAWLAVVVAAVVLSTAWTWTGAVLGAVSPILAVPRVFRWTSRGAAGSTPRHLRPGRVVAVVGATVMLLVVFGALFSSADPEFARLVDAATPQWDPGAALGRLLIFAAVTAGALCACYLLVAPPRFDRLAPAPRRSLRLWEWAVPLGALVALFAAFVAVQITTLFGGQDHVRTTDGLTNAEYARQGFWQLLAVTTLTLVVLAVVIGTAPRTTGQDRLALRVLLGGLCLLSLVVVASALHRMSLYEQQYGYTTLRLFVTAVELLLGSVFLLVMATGLTMSGRWLPRAVGVSAVLTVLGLSLLDPDAYIARHSVDRFEQTGKIDTAYLRGLSADAVPELDRLPEPYRSCVLADRDGSDRPWFEFNASEHRAKSVTSDIGPLACGAWPSVR